jgi:DNA mismatch endonuclease (patch repair protein)
MAVILGLLLAACSSSDGGGVTTGYTPKSRLDFWLKKFDENVKRDAMQRAKLKAAGWKVRVVWECQTADREALRQRLARMFVTPA